MNCADTRQRDRIKVEEFQTPKVKENQKCSLGLLELRLLCDVVISSFCVSIYAKGLQVVDPFLRRSSFGCVKGCRDLSAIQTKESLENTKKLDKTEEEDNLNTRFWRLTQLAVIETTRRKNGRKATKKRRVKIFCVRIRVKSRSLLLAR